MRRDESLHILQHGQGNTYRNRFVTTPRTDDWPLCMVHVEAGRQYVKEQSPAPPRLTRSQRRYRAYLAADSGLSFGEWLRTRATQSCRH